MKKAILLFSILPFILVSCKIYSSSQYTYHPPEKISDGFDVGSLAEVRIDSVLMEQAVDNINQGRYKEVHAMLIYRDGKLVFDEYFKGHQFQYDTIDHHGAWVTWDRTMLHRTMSVTKSITSACVGIAVEQGFIESVHQSIFEYLPEHQHFNKGGKDKITIEHLLTMTSGLEWNEWALPYGNLKNDVLMMYFAEDAVTYVLNKPLITEPGTNFYYAGGSNIILGEIIKHATKMNLIEFSGKYLFEPLGIAPYYWEQYKNGVVDAAGSLKIKPRDMAKIGVTFLNNGNWKGKKIISEQWVEKSATSFPGNSWLNNWDDHWGMRGYAYMWWTHQFIRSGKRVKMYYAGGWGGQYIMVIPELNIVVVFTGANYTSFRPAFEIFKKFVMPAIE